MGYDAVEDLRTLVKDRVGYSGDNLYRARAAARAVDPEKEWGASGQTLSAIIRGYGEEQRRWENASALLEKLLTGH